jgi:hypothetical protein
LSESSDHPETQDGDKREIKVTDRRMFTPDGELREEYKQTQGEDAAAPPASEETAPPAAAAPEPPAAAPPPADQPPPTPGGAPFEIPDAGGGPSPGFYDLIGILAEPASIYLQQAQQGGEDKDQNLEIARLHVELLDVLREKTMGNVSAEESAALEQVLYQLRMGYVQVRG